MITNANSIWVFFGFAKKSPLNTFKCFIDLLMIFFFYPMFEACDCLVVNNFDSI